ncbi:TPA: hypothetical protein U1C34_001848 [Streptococcus suis]|nr:hypothetical protein [Streptococcus suis]HEM3623040.1 hypothetical protein [Streptococcus suis]
MIREDINRLDKRRQEAPKNYEKKKRYTLVFYPKTREEKLEALVQYYGAKSASEYLEQVIEREWQHIKGIWRS